MAKQERFDVENVGAQGATLVNVITDKETGVQYMLAILPNVGSGLTVLVDADGKPLIKK